MSLFELNWDFSRSSKPDTEGKFGKLGSWLIRKWERIPFLSGFTPALGSTCTRSGSFAFVVFFETPAAYNKYSLIFGNRNTVMCTKEVKK